MSSLPCAVQAAKAQKRDRKRHGTMYCADSELFAMMNQHALADNVITITVILLKLPIVVIVSQRKIEA